MNQLPAFPFEGASHPSATSASNSSYAPGNGPSGSRLMNMSHSMDTINSNSGGLPNANQGKKDHPGAFWCLALSSSQKDVDRSPQGRESPFQALRQQVSG